MKKDGLAQIAIVLVSIIFFAGVLIYAENREEEPSQGASIEQLEEFLRGGPESKSMEGVKNLPLPPEILEQLRDMRREQLQQSGKK